MRFFDRLSGLFRREPVRFSTRTTGPSYTPAIDYTTKSILPGRIHLGGSLCGVEPQGATFVDKYAGGLGVPDAVAEATIRAPKINVPVGRVVVPDDDAWIDQLILDSRVATIRAEIARLRRNKKKHSHLQKELDALISGGASSGQEKED